MTTPTRREIIDAYKALEELYDWALEWAGTRAHSRYGAIRDVLPPKPQPTMAEVEWDDDKHYLAEAIHPLYSYVTMLEPIDIEDGPGVKFLCNDNGLFRLTWASPERLTPTGKRYTLTEVQE